MDPHTSTSQAANIWPYIGNQAVRSNREATALAGELVETWETPGDGTELIMHVRQGVKWHDKPPLDGRSLVADDIAFNLMRISGKLDPAKRASFQRASTLPNLDSATAVDERTVRVKLTRPHSSFMNGLSDFRNSIVARQQAESSSGFTKVSEFVGTGPFIMESFEDKVEAKFSANPAYWEGGKPYLSGVRWIWHGDRASALSAFAQSQFDYFESPSKTEIDSLGKLAKDARKEEWPIAVWYHFRFNTTRPPFNDPRVRKALFLAMDYKGMNDAFFGDGGWDYSGPLVSVFSEALTSAELMKLPGYNPASRDADIAAAKKLMSDAGFPSGNISFKFLPNGATGQHYENCIRATDQLKKIWPEIKIQMDIPADAAVFGKRQSGGDFDVIAYQFKSVPDALLDLASMVQSSGSRNYGKFSDPLVDELFAKAEIQLVQAERAVTMKEIQHKLMESSPVIGVGTSPNITYFLPRVKGMQGYGTRLGGGFYDNYFFTKDMWLES
jgi:peptide/nickel transport system substrate-binding protein